jgi:hypothetical protein
LLASTQLQQLDRNLLILPTSLVYNNNTILINMLVDTGATGFAFIDQEFVYYHQISTYHLKRPQRLEVIEKCPFQSGDIIHLVYLELTTNGHKEKSLFFITTLGYYLIVLGIP